MDPITVTGALQVAAQIKSAVTAAGNTEVVKALQGRSLIDVASVARVEPIALVDADCMNVESLNDLMQSLHSMFSGYYLQAVNMINTVGGVTVAQRLAPFNPNTGAVFEELRLDNRRAFGMEEFRHKLPLRTDKPSVALEDHTPGEVDSRAIAEVANLSIGKVFNVVLQAGDGKVSVPVAVRLLVNSVPSRMMVELLSSQDVFDSTMKERYHAWKSGRISFIKDLILCNDLIDKRVRTSLKDPTGLLNTIRQRESGNNVNNAMNGKASVANATNLAVVSSETLAAAEASLGGDIKNSKIRKALFESSNLMIVAVVNKQWERVVFYFRGLDASTTMSYKDLKAAGKSDGGNVVDILKAYMAGSAPSL